MISIRSSADMTATLNSLLDPDLRRLLVERRDQLSEYDGYDLGELVHIVVPQRFDTLAAVEAEAGVPLASNIVHGGSQGYFEPCFEYVERHGAWIEAVVVLNDFGFGVVLFVQDRIDTDPALLALLRHHI